MKEFTREIQKLVDQREEMKMAIELVKAYLKAYGKEQDLSLIHI